MSPAHGIYNVTHQPGIKIEIEINEPTAKHLSKRPQSELIRNVSKYATTTLIQADLSVCIWSSSGASSGNGRSLAWMGANPICNSDCLAVSASSVFSHHPSISEWKRRLVDWLTERSSPFNQSMHHSSATAITNMRQQLLFKLVCQFAFEVPLERLAVMDARSHGWEPTP